MGRSSKTTPQSHTEDVGVDCPVVHGYFDGQEIECLFDTGSQVTILPEPLFQQYFPKKKMSRDTPWSSLTAANELPIEVVGITWMKVKLWGQDLGQKGVVVTRVSGKGQPQVILGMNIIQGLMPELLKRCPTHLGPPKEVRNLLLTLAALKDKHVANALSRYPSVQPQRDVDEEAEEEEIPPVMRARPKSQPRVDLIHVLKEYNWAEIQKNDPVIAPVREAMQLQRWPSRRERSRLLPETQKLLGEWSHFLLRDGILYRRIMFPHDSSVTWQVVLSRARARQVAERIHVEGGHWGVQDIRLVQKASHVCGAVPVD